MNEICIIYINITVLSTQFPTSMTNVWVIYLNLCVGHVSPGRIPYDLSEGSGIASERQRGRESFLKVEVDEKFLSLSDLPHCIFVGILRSSLRREGYLQREQGFHQIQIMWITWDFTKWPSATGKYFLPQIQHMVLHRKIFSSTYWNCNCS